MQRKWMNNENCFAFVLINNTKTVLVKKKEHATTKRMVVMIWLLFFIWFSLKRTVSVDGNLMATALTLLISIIHDKWMRQRLENSAHKCSTLEKWKVKAKPKWKQACWKKSKRIRENEWIAHRLAAAQKADTFF